MKLFNLTTPIEDINVSVLLHKWPPFRIDDDITVITSSGEYYVPKGYKTDFLSLPAVVRPFMERVDETAVAALIHDVEYTLQDHTRKQIDDVFYEIMILSNTKQPKAKILWFAVRTFGWFVWYKKQLYRYLRANGWMKHYE